MRTLVNRLLHLLSRSRHDADLREEMETHRSLRQDKLEREGASTAEAVSASRRALGNVALAKEDAREVWLAPAIAGIWQDVRVAVRALIRRPVLTATAISTLALALGANIAIFSLIDRVVLRPLDVPDADTLATVEGTFESRGTVTRRTAMNWFYATRVRDMTTMSDAAIASTGRDAASRGMTATIPGRDAAIRDLRGRFVTANYFRTLGVRVAPGRDFRDDDDAVGAPAVVVLSHGFWQRHFGGDVEAVGLTIAVNGEPALIVGVAPRTFAGTDLADAPADFYVPVMAASRLATDTGVRTDGLNRFSNSAMAPLSPVSPLSNFVVIGRVAPADTNRVQAELAALNDSGQLVRFLVGTSQWHVRPLVDTMLPLDSGADTRRLLGLLAAAVGLTLLIGCANLSGLLLARGEERRTELAVRAALGAGRRRLMQSIAAEAGLLALAGGAVALVVAFWIDRGLSAFVLPGGVALSSLRDGVDLRVLLFAVVAVVVASVAIGVAPMARAGTRNLVLEVRARSTASPRLRTSRVLLAVQVAVCVVLVFLASLFVRSVSNALGEDFGFDRRNLLTASMAIPRGTLFDAAASEAVSERVRRIPGVVAATVGPLPISRGSDVRRPDVTIDGELVELPGSIDTVYGNADYFETLRLPVVAGRGFDAQDRAGAPLVALINEAAARQFWPEGAAIGRRIGLPPPPMMRAQGATQPDFAIVGIVRDVKIRSIKEVDQPVIYIPRSQHEPFLAGMTAGAGAAHLAIRTSDAPEGMASALAMAALDVGLSFQSVTTLDESLDGLLMPQRLGRTLLTLLGMMALLLTLVGIYGLVSCVVARGAKDIGIRMALGARASQVVSAIVRKAAAPMFVGAVVGSALAWFSGRFVDEFMYGMRGADPTTLVIAIVLIFATGVVAVLLPTWRALRINPVETLRAD